MSQFSMLSTYGTFDPIEIEKNYLRARLSDARRAGDQMSANIISRNLQSFEELRPTG